MLQDVHDAYDMGAHTQAGSPQAEQLTADFADGFAVVGSADRCRRGSASSWPSGSTTSSIVGPSLGADPTEARAAHRRFVTEVLPALHE